MNYIPLAERMRPKTLNDYMGQEKIVGPGAPLRNAIEQKRLPSIIFWGPPGVGKTTLAFILSKVVEREFFALSAINSGVKDIRDTISKAEDRSLFSTKPPVLFIDEIHRFSKSQQDSLLGAVEKGTITLIGATTENPSFEVISALLSRCQVFVLEALSITHLKKIIARALTQDTVLSQKRIEVEEYEALIKYSGGDARKLLNILEIIVDQYQTEPIKITNHDVEKTLQNAVLQYDKTGENHYDTISAFIKSVRGSDPDAAVYYLARMLEGGEDPIFICRRMIVLASEDIGLANSNALLLANACFDAVKKIGLPEGRIPMSQCAIYLALSPKSNSAYLAIDKATQLVRETGNLSIPLPLRNAPTKLMKELDYGKDYLYPHDHENAYVDFVYLPQMLAQKEIYKPKLMGSENKLYHNFLSRKKK